MSRSKEMTELIGVIEQGELKIFEGIDHTHEFNINEDGFGVSKMVESIDHIHEVVCFEVIPATEDGHTHTIPLPNEEWER